MELISQLEVTHLNECNTSVENITIFPKKPVIDKRLSTFSLSDCLRSKSFVDVLEFFDTNYVDLNEMCEKFGLSVVDFNRYTNYKRNAKNYFHNVLTRYIDLFMVG